MDIDRWLNNFGEPVAAANLKSPAATALVAFVERHAGHLATLVEARRGQGRDLVVLDFQTGRPQKSAHPIKRVERIGVRFTDDEAMPAVYMLRPDFPDTEHQQLVIEGFPRAICLDDRAWGEARLTWTPAELVERTLSWFARAGRGELHDARQPLDPVLFGTPLSFIIARDVLHRAGELDLVGMHDVDRQQILRVRPVQHGDNLTGDIEPICLIAYSIPPEKMQRLQFAPETLGSLADMLADRGIDLFADLRVRFSDWLDQAGQAPWRVLSRFAVIVEMPIIAPNGSHQDGTDLRAFLTDQRVGEIAEALGVALKSDRSDQGSRVGYVKAVVPKPEDTETLRAITAQSAEVHYEFDRQLATQMSGRTDLDDRHVVMVGAGAIGSHVADCLGREGRFRWTIIDDDRLLPHNIARHTGRDGDVTKGKADLVAASVSGTIHNPEPIARAIAANVLADGASRSDIDQALEEAEIVLDATASVLAARFLSDHTTGARRASVFFNPPGDAVVLLAEAADRSQTLRDLEAQYLGLVASDQRLAGHLSAGDGTYAYTGACRAITNLIPESRVMALSGLVSDGLSRAVDQDGAVIRIWSLRESGAVEICESAPAPVETFSAGDWSVSIDNSLIAHIQAMRAEHLPEETGGVLTGVVDIPAKRIHVVDAAPAPADS
ncbi:MAG TPA: ThiF family adenylyltransferase, partial [Alphaproteobacteria bacterium]|nr:ThiF family adenylyltransferase [Alphaproteobacteria bacterium]